VAAEAFGSSSTKKANQLLTSALITSPNNSHFSLFAERFASAVAARFEAGAD
jgi:hypothetical protein